jgi:hypothetical protein
VPAAMLRRSSVAPSRSAMSIWRWPRHVGSRSDDADSDTAPGRLDRPRLAKGDSPLAILASSGTGVLEHLRAIRSSMRMPKPREGRERNAQRAEFARAEAANIVRELRARVTSQATATPFRAVLRDSRTPTRTRRTPGCGPPRLGVAPGQGQDAAPPASRSSAGGRTVRRSWP